MMEQASRPPASRRVRRTGGLSHSPAVDVTWRLSAFVAPAVFGTAVRPTSPTHSQPAPLLRRMSGDKERRHSCASL
jgi:hypothetical protein